MADQTLTLVQLQQQIKKILAAPQLRNVWVTAELSDVRTSGGHCYMELLQKDDSGQIVAKCRAAIWANVYRSLAYNFRTVTGSDFATGLKVMLRMSVSYHEVFGLSMVVSDINPEFTMGDLLRRRRENILRLQREGILNANRELPLIGVPLRVAVISAVGAAGFGDFINQLAANPAHLAFKVKLFPARLQGEGTPASIIEALMAVFNDPEQWDCVVIIRGGGASSDLIAFEDYDLAAAVAQFPLPVIIGIGHERDVTLLDYVAFMRVKTPTAAAEWLIGRGEAALDTLRRAAAEVQRRAALAMSSARESLATIATRLAMAPSRQTERAQRRLEQAAMTIRNLSSACIMPMHVRLDAMAGTLALAARAQTTRQDQHIKSLADLIDAFSPKATLRRGFSITRIGDTALRSADGLTSGTVITTEFAKGTITSTVNNGK